MPPGQFLTFCLGGLPFGTIRLYGLFVIVLLLFRIVVICLLVVLLLVVLVICLLVVDRIEKKIKIFFALYGRL